MIQSLELTGHSRKADGTVVKISYKENNQEFTVTPQSPEWPRIFSHFSSELERQHKMLRETKSTTEEPKIKLPIKIVLSVVAVVLMSVIVLYSIQHNIIRITNRDGRYYLLWIAFGLLVSFFPVLWFPKNIKEYPPLKKFLFCAVWSIALIFIVLLTTIGLAVLL